jgi:hypothetical protein
VSGTIRADPIIVPDEDQMKNRGIRGLFIVAATSVLAACAAQPPASPASSAPVATAAPATASVATDKKRDPLESFGYRKVVKNGETVYCSKERSPDSRVKMNEQCLTAAQVQAIRDNGQDWLRRQQNHTGEQPTAGVNGGVQYGAASAPR